MRHRIEPEGKYRAKEWQGSGRPIGVSDPWFHFLRFTALTAAPIRRFILFCPAY
jgi:hypothetical protein